MGRILHISLMLFILYATNCTAQYSQQIQPLRTGQSLSPLAIGENVFQLEGGLDIGWGEQSFDTTVLYNKYNRQKAMLAYGITNSLDIEFHTALKQDNFLRNNRSGRNSGFSLAAFGARYNIYNGGRGVPVVGVHGLLKFPAWRAEQANQSMAPRFTFLFSYDPSKAITLTSNIGIDYSGNGSQHSWLYSFKSAFQLSPKVGSFIEMYGSYITPSAFHHLDMGLYYFVSDDFRLDVQGGMGVLKKQYESFFSIGFAYRFVTEGLPEHRYIYGEYE